MKRKIIGLDFDDVLVDFNESIRLFHNNIYGTSYEYKDVIKYDLGLLWKCSPNEIVARIHDFYNSEFHINTPPIEGAIEALRILSKENILVVITSRPESVRKVTLELLEKYFSMQFGEIHFLDFHQGGLARRKTKGEMCVEAGVEIFVEDVLQNAVTISNKGIPTLLFDRPWNQEKEPSNITRVFGWNDVLEQIHKI